MESVNKYIEWDFDPIIFTIYDPFAVRWYSLAFLLGFSIAYFVMLSIAKKEKKTLELIESLLTYTVVSTIIGARLGHCLFYDPIYYITHPWRIFMVWEGGLASHGGYLGIIIAWYLFSRKNKEMPFLWIADRCAMLAILTGSFIRIGNLFNSEIIGKVTDVPWAFIFTKYDLFPRHPTQIYESIGYAVTAGILFCLYKWTDLAKKPGRLLGASFVIAFTFRLFIEFFKENQEAFEATMSLNMGQLLSVPFIFFGLLLLLGIQDPKASPNYQKKNLTI